MRLGGEVDDDVDLLLRQHALDELEVADVALDEAHVEPIEVAPVAGVGEQVERHDVVVGVLLEPVADEVRADEAGGAGDEQPHRAYPALRRSGPRCSRDA